MEQQPNKPELLEDIHKAVTLLVLAVMAASRSVQLWSRVLGSCGPWYFGWLYLVCVGLQCLHYQLSVAASGRWDRIPLSFTLSLSCVLISAHALVSYFRLQPNGRVHSYAPGESVLTHWSPHWDRNSARIAGDLLVAVMFWGALHLLDSPVQAAWYGWCCVWLTIAHGWAAARNSHRRQAWRDSQAESEHWSNQL